MAAAASRAAPEALEVPAAPEARGESAAASRAAPEALEETVVTSAALRS